MNIRCALVALLLIGAHAGCHHVSTGKYKICVDGLALKDGESIVAYDLNVNGAIFDTVLAVPTAWTMSISNNSSGFTTLKAGVIDYSAGLRANELKCMAVVTKAQYADAVSANMDVYISKGETNSRKVQLGEQYVKVIALQ